MSKSRKSAKQTPPAADGAPQIDIGLSAGDRRKIADGLSHFLADSFTLYLRTHNFHWNVTGPMFNTLHLMFEGQYTEEWTALDAVAERIRALGYRAPGAYAEFVKLGSIAEGGEVDAADWRERPASMPEDRIRAFNQRAGQSEQLVGRTIYSAGFTCTKAGRYGFTVRVDVGSEGFSFSKVQ